MRVLVCAFSCHPDRGSEPASGWAVVQGLLELGHSVDLVTTSDLGGVALPKGLKTHRVAIPRLPGYLHRLNYSAWHRRAFRVAAAMHEQAPFEVVHHVTYGTVQAPCPLASLDARFVLGPAGGGQVAPRQFWREFGAMLPLELLRTLRVLLAPLRPGVRRMFRRSHAVFVTNRASESVARRAGARRVELMPDCCTPQPMLDRVPLGREDREPGLILWNGGMRRLKGVELALEAIALLSHSSARLVMAGDGPLFEQVKKRSSEMGLQTRVDFVGRVGWDEMAGLYRRSMAVLVTGFRDSLGSQFLEAGAAGTPCVCLNLHGAADVLPSTTVLRVDAANRDAVPQLLADALEQVLADSVTWESISVASRSFAETQAAQPRAVRFETSYGT